MVIEYQTVKVFNISFNGLTFNSIKRVLVYKTHLAKKFKSALQLFLATTLLIANVSFAESIFPSSLLTKRGSSTHLPLSVLAVKDQQGSDDNLNSFIEFEPSSHGYQGIFKFNVPPSPNNTIVGLILRANYRGPEKSVEDWQFDLLNDSGKWITIANNLNVHNWVWSDIHSSINDPDQFIDSKHQITLRYRTKSNADKSQLDYLTFEISSVGSNTISPATGSIGGDTNIPPPIVGRSGGRWQPTPGLKWQIQYTGTLDTSLNVDVYNIDVYDTSASVISELQSKGKHVICYFSAGSYENWRSDTGAFPASVLGQALDGWPGEKWLDIRQLDILIPIMQARMKLAADKGCNAVDPDNVDGYSNKTGFPLTYNDQLAYNIAIANAAHDLGLAVSLKNNLDQIKDLVDHFDFAVNEECFQYDECDALIPFVNAGKPVFGIEYSLSSSSYCPKANAMNFDFLKKKLSLDARRESCR